MVIFINDRPIRLIKKFKNSLYPPMEDYDVILDARLKPVKIADFKGHTCLLNVGLDQMEKIITELHADKPFDFHSLYILTDQKKELKNRICSLYQVIEAAGGVVLNAKDEVLWIYRLGKWDLPKGKLEKNEKFKKAAVREVLEECNVEAILKSKVCTTYHTYSFKNERILKRTKWFVMYANQSDALKPQLEENIEKVEWIPQNKMNKAVSDTYSSIRYVIQQFIVNQTQIPSKV
jgi:ADP-ribose pyrophosphatase YjhB (NUDIX family)